MNLDEQIFYSDMREVSFRMDAQEDMDRLEDAAGAEDAFAQLDDAIAPGLG